jgi:hypothetical protein
LQSRLHQTISTPSVKSPIKSPGQAAEGARSPEEIRISGSPPDVNAEDDASTKSDTSSIRQRKQQHSQSLLAAERRAREKIEALHRTILLGHLNVDAGDSTKHYNSADLDTDEAEEMAVGPDARKKAKDLAEQLGLGLGLAEEKLEVLRLLTQKQEVQVDKLEKSPLEPKSIEGAAESHVIDEEEVETEEQIRQNPERGVGRNSQKA